jgi:predicted metalloprotease with PDZ domain
MLQFVGWIASLICIIVLAPSASSQQQSRLLPAGEPVHYTLSPVIGHDGLSALRVAVTFNVGPDGSMLIRFPWRYAGREDLFANVSDIAVSSGEFIETNRPPEKLVNARPDERVTLSFVLRSGIKEEPTSADGQPFTPWILYEWMFLDGASVFPRLQLAASTPATFEWTGDRPAPFASDLTRFRTAADGGTIEDVIFGTVLAGEGVRILERGKIRLALRGDFPFADQIMLDGIAALLRELRRFWGDQEDDPYLVILVSTPLQAGYRAMYGGTGHGEDAFAAVTAGDVRFRDIVGGLFAHEIMHGWIPKQLSLPATTANAWFGEGFTEYYARLIPLRAGVTTLDDFIARWNEALVDYAVSPARNWTGERLAQEHWTNKDAELMPYNKGAMLAALWNARLRQVSQGRVGLDDVVRLQRILMRTADRSPSPGVTEPEGLFAAHARNAGVELVSEIAAHVVRGDTIVLPPDTFGRCIVVETVVIPSYDRGFDLEASIAAGHVATGVRPNGPAYMAGLRDGMRLIRPIEGQAGNATIPSVWVVESDGQERTVSWKPVGTGEVTIQRLLRVPGSPEDVIACGL